MPDLHIRSGVPWENLVHTRTGDHPIDGKSHTPQDQSLLPSDPKLS